MMPHEDWLLTEGYRDSEHPGTAHAVGAEFLLAGHNVFRETWYDGALDGIVGPKAAAAFAHAKSDIGYPDDELEPTFGPRLRDFLTGATPQTLNMRNRAALRRPKFLWPTVPHGTVIGFPGQGTHSFRLPPNNWESDNAWDIAVPVGSKVIAIADGKIGPEFGPLPDPDPRFHGIRLHLATADNEFYYAHLSATTPGLGPGDTVKRGEILGLSGTANGVAHLHIGVERLIRLEDV